LSREQHFGHLLPEDYLFLFFRVCLYHRTLFSLFINELMKYR
jgi:hypothetical protein